MIGPEFYVSREGAAVDGHHRFVTLRQVGKEKTADAQHVKLARISAAEAAAFTPGRKFRVKIEPID